MEDRLGEGVEVGEDLAALGTQRVGVVEDRGNATLLGEGWERYGKSAECVQRDRLSAMDRALAELC